jgi:hypothetical protein
MALYPSGQYYTPIVEKSQALDELISMPWSCLTGTGVVWYHEVRLNAEDGYALFGDLGYSQQLGSL